MIPATPKTILVEPGGPEFLNVGDNAMVVASIERLRALWPDATIRVATKAPDRVRSLLPNVEPIMLPDRFEWMESNSFGRVPRLLPRGMGGILLDLDNSFRGVLPKLHVNLFLAKSRVLRHPRRDLIRYLDAIARSDAFILTGAGLITDAFRIPALMLLSTMRYAQHLGVPTMILGNMIGPVVDRRLRQLCEDVLRRTTFTTLREGVTSTKLLRDLGVSKERFVITGDEAVEAAYAQRSGMRGRNGLGVNIRIADYSGLQPDQRVAEFSVMIANVAAQIGAEVIPVPIARHSFDDDIRGLRRFSVANLNENSTGPHAGALDVILTDISRCRVVVTGSYHAAVFALAQGIPAIGIAFSDYYRAKFLGLADLFRHGFQWIDGGEPGWISSVSAAIFECWVHADENRLEMLSSAERQIAATDAAYARLGELYAEAASKRSRRRLGTRWRFLLQSTEAMPE